MGKDNFLIVGAGLSGITVAFHLIKKGKKVTIVNSGINHSSLVAAGQINPLVFRRMTKSWRVDDFIPYLNSFYKELEALTNAKFFIPIPIRRIFSSEHEKELWLKKQQRVDFKSYMEIINDKDENYDLTINEFGTGRIKNSIFIDAKSFLENTLRWISLNGDLINETFDYNSVNPLVGEYNGRTYDHIIFCEGSMNNNNPWFNNFPVESTKGEVLTLYSKDFPKHESLNRKCFLLPIGDDKFRLGATYVWETDNLRPTKEGRAELLDKLNFLSKEKYECISHEVGIRPTSPDRRPIVGKHTEFSKLSIFNGLGTKGYMIAPLLAKEFVDYLTEGAKLDPEVRIERFFNKR